MKIREETHPNNYVFIEYVRRRCIEKNTNCTIFVTGNVGTGKSYACVRLGQLFARATNTKFNVGRQIVYSAKDFLRFISSDHPPGTVIIFEEAGTNLSSRESMSKSNIMFGKLLQTLRYKNLIAIFNVPSFGFVDKQVRELTDFKLITDKIIRSRKICRLKIYHINSCPYTHKILNKFLEYYHPVYGVVNLCAVYLKKPHKYVIDRYEKSKNDYVNQMIASMNEAYDPEVRLKAEEEQKRLEQEKKEFEASRDKAFKKWNKEKLDKLELEVYNLYGRKGVVKEEVAKYLDITPSNVQGLRRSIEKKLNIVLKCGEMKGDVLEKNQNFKKYFEEEKK